MIFNNVDFNDLLVVESIDRNLLPSLGVVARKVSGKLGYRYFRNEIGTNTVKVNIRIVEENRIKVMEKARKIAGLLMVSEPKKLILRDEPNLYILAIPQGDTPLEKLMYTGAATIEFLCPDPTSYSQTETVESNIGSRELINPGTLHTHGILTVNFNNPAPYTKLTLLGTGEDIKIEGPFITGDQLVIDLGEEWVRKNGNLVMKDVHIESDFFDIPRGAFTIAVTHGVAELRYRARWI